LVLVVFGTLVVMLALLVAVAVDVGAEVVAVGSWSMMSWSSPSTS
jgi:hypothetical protein